jgi:hypothetical protein
MAALLAGIAMPVYASVAGSAKVGGPAASAQVGDVRLAASSVTAKTAALPGLSRAGRASRPSIRRLPAGNPNGHAFVPLAARAVGTSHPTRVVGSGTAASYTSRAVVSAVARGGIITFSCGPAPVTILMTATAKVRNTSHSVVLDGGGKVTLSGGGVRRILYQNTCDPRQTWTTSHCDNQEWPRLVVQNITFTDGYSPVRQTPTSNYGGGAIFAEGGQLKVVNSRFTGNRCYRFGPDLGGAAIRALDQWRHRPLFITSDTFRGGRCSNGGALSSIGVSWTVLNSVMTGNRAIGWGQNPQRPGTRGGGSGGAIYNDGNTINLKIEGTIIKDNHAREGGGAIFFVSDDNTGSLRIQRSTLRHNPSGQFHTFGYPGIFFHSRGHPIVTRSTIN